MIAVGTQAVQGDGEDVAGFGAIDIEGTHLRIAEQRAGDAVFVHAAGIERARAHRVAGPEQQHRRTMRAEFVGIVRGYEIEDARGRGPRWQAGRGEGMFGAAPGLVGIREVRRSRQPVAGLHAAQVVAPVAGDGGQPQPVVLETAGQRVAVQRAVQPGAHAGQFQRLIDRIAPQIDHHPPAFGFGGAGGKPAQAAAQQDEAGEHARAPRESSGGDAARGRDRCGSVWIPVAGGCLSCLAPGENPPQSPFSKGEAQPECECFRHRGVRRVSPL